MRRFLLAASLAATVAIAQEDPFIKGDALRENVAKRCADGCVIWTREEAAQFDEEFDVIVKRIRAEAFRAGMEAQKQACRSLI
jgi:hypothetical protein